MPGLHQSSRSRSLASVAIWVTAFVVMVFIAAWQFKWLPTSEVELGDSGPKPGFESTASTEDGSHPQHLDALNLADEHALFALQQEPEIPTDQVVISRIGFLVLNKESRSSTCRHQKQKR